MIRYAPYILPVAEPVSLVAAKLHARVDDTADDELIKAQVAAAVDWCEKYERQSYMIRSYKGYLDKFANCIELPMPPLVSVDSITYVDNAGDTQTLATSYYTVDTESVPGRVFLAYGKSWPTTRSVRNAVTITFTAGYATTFTTAFATDLLTVGNSVFADGDRVRVGTDQGGLPAPLAIKTDYYVRDVSEATCKLAATAGGAAIDITDDGTGIHYIGFANKGLVPDRVTAAVKLLFAHLYENRETELVGVSSESIKFSVKNLLCERVWLK